MIRKNNFLKNDFKSKNIFKVNFDESVKDFGSKDGIISMIFCFYLMIIVCLFILFVFKAGIYWNSVGSFGFYRFVFYLPIVAIELVPVFIIIKIRKQSIKSIGIKTNKIFKSIFLGIIFSIPFILLPIISAVNQGKKIMDFKSLIWAFLYFFFEIAFVEEIVFRGFIQTRIQGMIRSKWLSIIVVGIMFALSHIPVQVISDSISEGMPLGKFIINSSNIDNLVSLAFNLADKCAVHIYLVYVYTRDNNIISSTVTHTLIDLIQVIFI